MYRNKMYHTIAHIQRNSQNILHNGQAASMFYLRVSLYDWIWRQDRHGTCTVRPALRGVKSLFAVFDRSTQSKEKIQEVQNALKKITHHRVSFPRRICRNSTSAARAGISLSKFAKLVCTGIPVPSLEHKQAVQEIIKARADLGRLGGLLKQAIAAGGDKMALQRLLQNVDAGMRELKAAALKIQ